MNIDDDYDQLDDDVIKSQRLQILLSASRLHSLSDDKKLEFIISQGKRIMANWEVDCLVAICQSKNCPDKGLAVVYEYAGYLDRIRELLSIKHHIGNRINDAKESSNFKDLCENLQLLAKITAKLLYALCCLRRLQSSPQPMFIRSGSSLLSGKYLRKLSLATLLREEAKSIWCLLVATPQLIRQLPMNRIGLLLSCGLEILEFRKYCISTYNIEMPQSIELLFEVIPALLIVEDKVESTWNSTSGRGDKSSGNLYDNSPLLRLPYESGPDPMIELLWFNSDIAKYKIAGNIVKDLIRDWKTNSAAENTDTVPVEISPKAAPPPAKESKAIFKKVAKTPEVIKTEQSASAGAAVNSMTVTAPRSSPVLLQQQRKQIANKSPSRDITAQVNTRSVRRAVNSATAPDKTQSQSQPAQATRPNGSASSVRSNKPTLLSTDHNFTTVVSVDAGVKIDSNSMKAVQQTQQQAFAIEETTDDIPVRQRLGSADTFSPPVLVRHQSQNQLQDDNSAPRRMTVSNITPSKQLVELREAHRRPLSADNVGVSGPQDSRAANRRPSNDRRSSKGSDDQPLQHQERYRPRGATEDLQTYEDHCEQYYQVGDDKSDVEEDLRIFQTNPQRRLSGIAPADLNRITSAPTTRYQLTPSAQRNSTRRPRSNTSLDSDLCLAGGDDFDNNGDFMIDENGELIPASPQGHAPRKYSFSSSRVGGATLPNRMHGAVKGRYHSKSVEALEVLSSLMQPYSRVRGESMAESQVVHIALRNLHIDGRTVLEVAQIKVATWWRLIGPRRKLLKRMSHRKFMLSILGEIIDCAVSIGIAASRRRHRMLHDGAAATIQRIFRYWRSTVLESERRAEFEERRVQAWFLLDRWSSAVLASCMIFNFIKRFRHSRLGKVKKAPTKLRYLIESYFLQLSLSNRDVSKHGLRVSVLGKYSAQASASNNRRAKLYKRLENAAVKVQSQYRAHLAKLKVAKMRHTAKQGMNIMLFFRRNQIDKNIKLREIKRVSSVKIQRIIRGKLARLRLYKNIEAGMKLSAMWHKHRAIKNLKQSLRRVERPHNIVLHGLRNIPPQFIHATNLRFKVSVWWHPLLHIVSDADYMTIVQTKQPQYVYTSGLHPVAKEHPLDSPQAAVVIVHKPPPKPPARPPGPEKSPVSGRRKSIHNTSNKVSPAPASVTKTPQSRNSTVTRKLASFTQQTTPDCRTSMVVASTSSTLKSPAQQSPSGPLLFSPNSLPAIVPAALKPSQMLLMSTAVGDNDDDDDDEDEAGDVFHHDGLGRGTINNRDEDDSDLQDPLVTLRNAHNRSLDDRPSTASQRGQLKNSNNEPTGALAAIRNTLKRLVSGFSTNPSAGDVNNSQEEEDSDNEEESKGKRRRSRDDDNDAENDEDDEDDEEGEGGGEEENEEEEEDSCPNLRKTHKRNHSVESDSEGPDPLLAMRLMRSTHRSKSFLHRMSSTNTHNSSVQSNHSHSHNLSTISNHRMTNTLLSSFNSRSTLAIIRNTLHQTVQLIGSGFEKKAPVLTSSDIKNLMCNFNDETVRIPGCHGNSVFKFEFLEGERRIASTLFFMRKEGSMMYWGGEYAREVAVASNRRAVQFNARLVVNHDRVPAGGDCVPSFEFRVDAGPPNRSRTQWAVLRAKGSGPFKRKLQTQSLMNTFFDNWMKFYLTLDGDGLHVYESKHSTSSFAVIPRKDFAGVRVEIGAATPMASKSHPEDNFNVVLKTNQNDELFMRFADGGSRVCWFEAFSNILQDLSKSGELVQKSNGWTNALELGNTMLGKASSPSKKTPSRPNSRDGVLSKESSTNTVHNIPSLLSPAASFNDSMLPPPNISTPQSSFR